MTRWLALLFILGGVFLSQAQADDYPKESVTIVNPFPAGSPVDLVARVTAEELQKALGRPFVVLNKAGAGGVLGAQSVAMAKSDGYTLLLTSTSTQIIAPELRKQMPYDARKSFVPISQITRGPLVVVVHPSLPVHSLRELIDYAKKNPDKVTYASSGFGTILHLAAELFQARTGTKLFHVPYNGAAPALTALVGGHVQVMFDSISNATPQIQAGTVRALAVLTSNRVELLPGLSTAQELGVSGLEFPAWMGLFAPAGVPADVVQKIENVLRVQLRDKSVVERFSRAGLVTDFVGAERFGQLLDEQTKVVRETIKAAKIEPQ